MASNGSNIGHIKQVIGPTVDLEYHSDNLPNINNAITIQRHGSKEKLTVEVAQHIGNNTVRCVSMGSTDGLIRGMECVDTGAPISVPVGEQVLGHIFNLLGEPLDDRGALPHPEKRWPIHRDSSLFTETLPATEVL
jgi:F-type H+-transporting ATPase subunit beta